MALYLIKSDKTTREHLDFPSFLHSFIRSIRFGVTDSWSIGIKTTSPKYLLPGSFSLWNCWLHQRFIVFALYFDDALLLETRSSVLRVAIVFQWFMVKVKSVFRVIKLWKKIKCCSPISTLHPYKHRLLFLHYKSNLTQMPPMVL